MSNTLGLVVIGRNEGERLRRCLASASGGGRRIVYVDSGSTDSSVATARAMGIDVVELDLSIPFTAARARNAGLDRLRVLYPDLAFVQFLDGDCEMAVGWLETALAFLRNQPRVAAVGGRLHERFPEASIYNHLCDLEWHTAIGNSAWCGGNAMMRAAALDEAGAFNPGLIAGEEPELCLRLRAKGWSIHRLDADVAMHDANMHRLGQWWRRATRSGYAFAEGARLHGAGPERYCVRQVRSGWLWGLFLPLELLAASWPTRGLSLVAGLLVYGVLLAKIRRHAVRSGVTAGRWATRYAFFTVLGKCPQAIGQLRYIVMRWRGRKSALIEYKDPSIPVLAESRP